MLPSFIRRIGLLCFLTGMLLSAPLASEEDPLNVTIPAGLAAGTPGSYDLSIASPIYDQYKTPIRALYYIPPSLGGGKAKGRPLVLFFHGHTKDASYYKTQVGYMLERAAKDNFSLLSMQNPWPLANDNSQTITDARYAANLLLHRLDGMNIYNRRAVYTTGFSSGGFTAWLVCMDSLNPFVDTQFKEKMIESYKTNEFNGTLPDNFDVETHFFSWKPKAALEYPYAGFASFKGNFYDGQLQLNPMLMGMQIPYAVHYPRIFAGKLAYMTIGGVSDAPRVREQAPQLRAFLKGQLGIDPVYKEFPAEGHVFLETNWRPFWDLVEKRLQ